MIKIGSKSAQQVSMQLTESKNRSIKWKVSDTEMIEINDTSVQINHSNLEMASHQNSIYSISVR